MLFQTICVSKTMDNIHLRYENLVRPNKAHIDNQKIDADFDIVNVWKSQTLNKANVCCQRTYPIQTFRFKTYIGRPEHHSDVST